MLVTKILTLSVALSYAFSGVQQLIHPNPFVLWCEEDWYEEIARNLTFCTWNTNDPNFTSCFNNRVELRVCDNNESSLRIGLFLLLTLSNLLSLAASLWLNKISNYVQLYKETKKFLWRSVQQIFVNRKRMFFRCS